VDLQDPLHQSKPAYAGRMLYEAHWYAWSAYWTDANCGAAQQRAGDLFGYLLTSGKNYTAPVFMSEFGSDVWDGSGAGASRKTQCVRTT